MPKIITSKNIAINYTDIPDYIDNRDTLSIGAEYLSKKEKRYRDRTIEEEEEERQDRDRTDT